MTAYLKAKENKFDSKCRKDFAIYQNFKCFALAS